MAEFLLKPRKSYSAMCVAQFSVKEICAIVSDMAITTDKLKTTAVQTVAQTESERLNNRLSDLLRRISNNDKLAFEQFYDNTIKLCYSQALRITKQEGIAEEVISDLYMQVWNKANRYDKTRSGVMTWLMMLCRSRALDALRRRKSLPNKESTDIDDLSTPEANPQDILLATQQGSLLKQAIFQLKPQQRQLLSLAYFKGLTHAEIANYTEIPLGTVKTQIRRAIILLKELMSEQSLATVSDNRRGESYE